MTEAELRDALECGDAEARYVALAAVGDVDVDRELLRGVVLNDTGTFESDIGFVPKWRLVADAARDALTRTYTRFGIAQSDVDATLGVARSAVVAGTPAPAVAHRLVSALVAARPAFESDSILEPTVAALLDAPEATARQRAAEVFANTRQLARAAVGRLPYESDPDVRLRIIDSIAAEDVSAEWAISLRTDPDPRIRTGAARLLSGRQRVLDIAGLDAWLLNEQDVDVLSVLKHSMPATAWNDVSLAALDIAKAPLAAIVARGASALPTILALLEAHRTPQVLSALATIGDPRSTPRLWFSVLADERWMIYGGPWPRRHGAAENAIEIARERDRLGLAAAPARPLRDRHPLTDDPSSIEAALSHLALCDDKELTSELAGLCASRGAPRVAFAACNPCCRLSPASRRTFISALDDPSLRRIVVCEFTGDRCELLDFLSAALQVTERDTVAIAAHRVEALGLRELNAEVARRAHVLEPGFGPISSCSARLHGQPEPVDPDEPGWGL
jgi:hypothetical protein